MLLSKIFLFRKLDVFGIRLIVTSSSYTIIVVHIQLSGYINLEKSCSFYKSLKFAQNMVKIVFNVLASLQMHVKPR